MAALLNKWLLFSVIPAFFYISGKPETVTGYWLLVTGNQQPVTCNPHPFHVSVLELNHNAADKTLEISCKIFTDDFEKVLAQNYKAKVDLINPPDRKAMDSLVKKYVLSHLSINADGRPVRLTYLGFEHDNEAVYSYIQADNLPSVKKIDLSNKIMHDLFNDQINIMHITVGGKRKSTKLDYPAVQATLEF